MYRSIARQLADKKIWANSVAPYPIWTPIIPASLPPDKVAKFGQDTLLRRPGQVIHPDSGEVLNT